MASGLLQRSLLIIRAGRLLIPLPTPPHHGIAAVQKIPGRVKLAYYDFGGEGVAFHDTTPKKSWQRWTSIPLDGDYLNEFRH